MSLLSPLPPPRNSHPDPHPIPWIYTGLNLQSSLGREAEASDGIASPANKFQTCRGVLRLLAALTGMGFKPGQTEYSMHKKASGV